MGLIFKLSREQLPQAKRLASAYDFYLKKDIKPLIDKLDVLTDEWQALEQAKSLKTDPATASLFNDWGVRSGTRKDYLIVTLSLISYEEFEILISSNTPSSVIPESGIANILAREPATAL